MSRRPESERSDWTDLDLLTREEAAGRLQEEIADIEPRLGDADPGERELLQTRLHALREAVDELAAS
ncbi:hypothetical protein AMES_7069 [Amycolatopsis mediterranei S699]|uniref:Uncharacterized protein n=2 Tax=Amycolatopsis mediterranei TaxID=33910 RepID=A0A0H3DD94_AMYMU|nr:hypothetical protein [Amycolatopsis mediterranei]ADJ48895.1 hypothetical protein AMED_7178 [Amycolatopsis mediterranei U32]AEK45843.1 hypothetical protein RAM_36870 [Amycolatopsis mediterranei S699]AFO80603.1 hypothetical protein AMES_7069 [Amycolatopsis mediterranei S699]AGT87731.1 hypothetical protein B737_7069 [Amycolatopsis mediterranei RB]KDU93988.1 hypothetical protein DV36_01210 [Amycolatopsis mediterranei]